MARRPVIAGNWKMHGSLASAGALASAVVAGLDAAAAAQVWLLPAFPHLAAVAAVLDGGPEQVALGAQDLATAAAGAHTGEVSAAMLLDVGAGVVLVGHSERRANQGEDDELVAAKLAAALGAGLVPVLCIGESLTQRRAGAAEATVLGQLDAALPDGAVPSGLVVAYEPVWAIGSGETATPEQAQAMHAAIRARLAERDPAGAGTTRLLYGGSVKADNAAALLAQPDIDGALVGGASLDAEEFLAICHAAGA